MGDTFDFDQDPLNHKAAGKSSKLKSILNKFSIIPKGKGYWHPIFRISIIVATLVTIFAVVFGLIYAKELGLFDFDEQQVSTIVNWKPQDNTIIYDREEKKIGEFFSNYQIYVPFEELPKQLVNAIVAIEDRNFWEHNGFDPKAMLRAAWVHIKGGSKKYRQGASTITQQIVRHFLLSREKTINRKIKEIFLAQKLESYLEKKKIIEIYANIMFLGNGSYGVGAAAKRYFSKNLDELKTHELALIAGLFQSPSRYNPHRSPKIARKRQRRVLRAMRACDFLSKKEYKTFLKKKLNYKKQESLFGQKAPYFKDYIQEQAKLILKRKNVKNQGYRIFTTLDSQLQKFAEEAVDSSAKTLAKMEKNMLNRQRDKSIPPSLEAAILVTDPRNGEVLAMVGGRDYKKSQFNRTVQATRQPGSAFKPIVYALALQQGYRWSDRIYVSPITLSGNYRPRTPKKDYLTETTVLRAFYRSMNTPTIELSQKLGLKSVIDYGKKIGFTTPLKFEFGTMLGSSETTMLNLTRVYSVFANKGLQTDQIAIKKIEDFEGNVIFEAQDIAERQREVMSPQLSFLMTQGMRQVLVRGTARRAHDLSAVAAGKTGTSNGSKDNWFAGYTSNMVGVVWVGSDEAKRIYGNAHGGTLALPIWKEFMKKAVEYNKPSRFSRPSGVKVVQIHPKYGQRTQGGDGMNMWFFEDMMPSAKVRQKSLSKHMESFRDDPFAN